MRIRCLSLKTRQTSRTSTIARHDPDVIRICETDLSGTDGRSSKQSRLASVSVLSAAGNCGDDRTQSEQKYAVKHGACPPKMMRVRSESRQHYRSSRSYRSYRWCLNLDFSVQPLCPLCLCG